MPEFEPRSRNEALLNAIRENTGGGTGSVDFEPRTRNEYLLNEIRKNTEGGSGSGLPDVTAADNGKVLGVADGARGTVEQPLSLTAKTGYRYSVDAYQLASMRAHKPFIVIQGSSVGIAMLTSGYNCIIIGSDGVYIGTWDMGTGVFPIDFWFYRSNRDLPVPFYDLPNITVPGHRNYDIGAANLFLGYDAEGYLGFRSVPQPPEPFTIFTVTDPAMAAQFVAILAAMKQMAAAASDGTYIGYIPMDCTNMISAAETEIRNGKGIYNELANVGQTVSGYTMDGNGNLTSVQYTGCDFDASGSNPIVYTIETTLTPTMMIGKVVAKTATAFPIS